MVIEKLIKKRQSIRKYSSKPVNFNKIAEICDVARFIPCAGNIPTIKLVIVNNKEKIDYLAQASQQPFIGKAKYILIVCSDLKNLGKAHGERALKMYSRQQAGAAVQNMLLKATELGLASCWVGWFDEEMVKRICFIPDQIQIEALIPIAYPFDKKTSIKKKSELDNLCFFEKWNQKQRKLEKLSGQ